MFFHDQNDSMFLDTSLCAAQLDHLSFSDANDLLPLNWDAQKQEITPTPVSEQKYREINCELTKLKGQSFHCAKVWFPDAMTLQCVYFDPVKLEFRTAHNEMYTFCPDSDKFLEILVRHFDGRPNWKFISDVMRKQCPNGRVLTPQQCYQRYNRVSRPGLVKGRWSQEDNRRLYTFLNQFSSSQIAEIFKRFPDRSDNQVRYKIKQLYPAWFSTY